MPLRREDGGSLTEIGKVYREDGGSLTEIQAVYREQNGSLTQVYSATVPPANLSASFDNLNDEVNLSWDADPEDSQDVYRCQNCEDPFSSGTKIADVGAGVGSYTDTGPTCDGGRTWVYEVIDPSEADSTNTASVTEPPCFD